LAYLIVNMEISQFSWELYECSFEPFYRFTLLSTISIIVLLQWQSWIPPSTCLFQGICCLMQLYDNCMTASKRSQKQHMLWRCT
jgi:hypothetical protein